MNKKPACPRLNVPSNGTLPVQFSKTKHFGWHAHAEGASMARFSLSVRTRTSLDRQGEVKTIKNTEPHRKVAAH